MPATLQPLRQLTREVRVHGPALLGGVACPHDELMSLVWGPRFDREHALGLLARQPSAGLSALPALLAAADTFDALQVAAQRRLRELIRRHRVLSLSEPGMDDAELDEEDYERAPSAFRQAPAFAAPPTECRAMAWQHAAPLGGTAGGWARANRAVPM